MNRILLRIGKRSTKESHKAISQTTYLIITVAPFRAPDYNQLLLLQVLESSATEIDSGAVQAPLGNGGKARTESKQCSACERGSEGV